MGAGGIRQPVTLDHAAAQGPRQVPQPRQELGADRGCFRPRIASSPVTACLEVADGVSGSPSPARDLSITMSFHPDKCEAL